MSYKDFNLSKAQKDLSLTIQEVPHFLSVDPIPPDQRLADTLAENLPLAIQGNEKARSEWIVSPILTAVRRMLNQQISIFSGRELNVDPALGLNGYVDFMISRSPRLLTLEAPIITIVEAKPESISAGLGQSLAEMVAAQRFNQEQENSIHTVYGCVTTGELWRFLKLEGNIATIDLVDYILPPVDTILGALIWIAGQG